ncbi:MAG TPA: GNAT family N-acetyltransferase [Thermohalobaculum sp.]|nr:GNAT family N-acetyltransferase [Thermohalobaculum sp.]
MNLTLKSDRLLLRPLGENDLDICFEQFTDPQVMQHLGKLKTRQQVVDNMSDRCRRAGGGCIGVWCLIDQVTAEKFGTAILLPLPIDRDDIDWSLVHGAEIPPGEIQIGYILKRSAWGRGYATEACRRQLRFAFADTPMEEIVATTDPENAASQRVLTKCGLASEGHRRAYNTDDISGFRISKAEWLSVAARH